MTRTKEGMAHVFGGDFDGGELLDVASRVLDDFSRDFRQVMAVRRKE